MHIHDKFYRFNKVSWASWLAEPHTWPRSETRVKPDIISWQMVHNLISDSTVFCSMNFTFRHYNDTSVVCNSTESGKYTHFWSVCCNNRWCYLYLYNLGTFMEFVYYRCNDYMFFKVCFLFGSLSMTSQAFTSKMFDNFRISWGLR